MEQQQEEKKSNLTKQEQHELSSLEQAKSLSSHESKRLSELRLKENPVKPKEEKKETDEG